MKNKSLEERIHTLEDIEAIKGCYCKIFFQHQQRLEWQGGKSPCYAFHLCYRRHLGM